MENILNMVIRKMIIHNFKGVKDLTLDFTNITNVYAQNGGFKTTIADAWFWCLYGKDSHDRKDFNIKNTVDTSLNRGDHEVTLFLTTGSNEDVFKRVFREKWVKPKGQKDAVYSGNETLYYCNEVPMQAKEYQAKIDSIIAEGALKLLTNPNHFNALKWTERRNILFDLAGNVSNTEIANIRPEFAALINSLSNKTLVEYKREVSAKKKKLKEDLTAIPTRIDELQRSLPGIVDYAAIQADIDVKRSSINDIETAMNDRTTAYDNAYRVIQSKQQQIHSAKTAINQYKFDVQSQLQERVNAVRNKRSMLQQNVDTIERDIKSKNILISSSEAKVNDLSEKTEALRLQWVLKNETVLLFHPGEFSCPTCKRDLEQNDIESKKSELAKNFNADKEFSLNQIADKAGVHKKEVDSTNQLLETLKTALGHLTSQLLTAKNELSIFEDQNSAPVKSVEEALITDQKYISLSDELLLLESQLIESPVIDLSDLNVQRQAITLEIDSLKSQLATKTQRENALSRLTDLENDESNLAQQIADLEGIEFNIDDFNRAKIETTESRINGLFGYVKFKLFDKKIDGEEFEVCETMYNGVPFSDLNTAGKIWAGIDIINTLSQYYKVSAPIFLDNRESVTDIPEIHCQIINLIVSPKDKILRVA
jgi:exonuclease SbcC